MSESNSGLESRAESSVGFKSEPKVDQETEHEQPLLIREINGVEFTILGTAHVSQASADAVAALIAENNFDAVAIELCADRLRSIDDVDADAHLDLFQVIRAGKVPMIAASLMLGAYQQRLADKLGIKPGAEMRVAIELARASDTPLLLIDRNIGITLRRVYKGVPWWKRMMLVSGLFGSLLSRADVSESDIEELKRGDMLNQVFSEFSGEAPEIYKSLVDERDQYMAAKLGQYAQGRVGEKILAVVGAGHLKGMAGYIDAPPDNLEQRLQELDTIPQGRSIVKWLPWLITALVITGFIIGFSRSPELGWQLLLEWLLINGGLAALGGIIALAHPLTIVTAFFAAPLTSLNPMLGVGMVTGLVETFLRKPRVMDFKRLRVEATSLKGWYHNRVSRTLLVFLLTTVGSAAGTYIAGFRIAQLLSGASVSG
ncbi:MAG: TraB/GumN family protein [Gammaproteobacteria bacterium]|nr:TraB/GumN family protein [Gammaproteobacteria bacterium]